MNQSLAATLAAPPATATANNVVLSAENITKVFPGTMALDDVTFEVQRGLVNWLFGENGAGMSTVIKILAGVEQPSKGRVLLGGQEIHLHSPSDAARHGIGIIYQELNLCPNLSVMDNIFLAREKLGRGVIDRKSQRQLALKLVQILDQTIEPDTLLGNLRIGQQQIVEIAKALMQDVRVLIMDEPTSALSTAEVEVLFDVIRGLKGRGVSIIYISHKLDELMQIGDNITVLRDGRIVAHSLAHEVGVPWIVEKMVGRNPAALFTRQEHTIGEPLLRVEDITLPRVGGGYVLDHVSFTLRVGEILGFYGLMGAGRTDLLDCLAGLRPEATGKIWLNDREVRTGSVAERIAAGFVLVPEDRQRDGVVPTLSVADNMLLASLKKYLSGFYLAKKKEQVAVETLIKDLSIRVANPQQSITSLSGGNQQKVVVAKGLLTAPKVLMLDEPTRGVDVGAKSEIFEIMSRLAVQGYGVLFVSSELKEILAMSDRILVLSKGALTGEFARGEATEEKLVTASVANGHVNGSVHSTNGRKQVHESI